ncbi:hypothetical protein M409DRAFT_61556 [Zasmidium cellare ATCC 36951]|uniref:Uncharacterized protein n=1 Tax=Zasmidium cellare ATCC 36951 TaxID=1080233 RepID=A0A6A6BUS5_ZASCE|nr:uncharacterized protein M409DRAFT_61556 [Zasmidium cellare ATCC 36951]KAF2158544.1 hypothetical protein M409DRAFT_61556 [Zasmidium cellare ATCC 36951]
MRVFDFVDKETVDALQGLCPLWSAKDAKKTEDMMEEDTILGRLSEQSERAVVVDHLLRQPRILSFRTFRTDCHLLEICARNLMKALFLTKTRTFCLKDALEEIYVGDCFERSYLDMWLSAIRCLPRPHCLNAVWKDFLLYLRLQAHAFGFRRRAVGQSPAEYSSTELNEKGQATELSTDRNAASKDERRPLTSVETFYQNQKFFTTGSLARSMHCDRANIVRKKFATPLAVLYDLVDCFGLVPGVVSRWNTETPRQHIAPEHVTEPTQIHPQPKLDGVREALAPSFCYIRSSYTPSSPSREMAYHDTDAFHDG